MNKDTEAKMYTKKTPTDWLSIFYMFLLFVAKTLFEGNYHLDRPKSKQFEANQQLMHFFFFYYFYKFLFFFFFCKFCCKQIYKLFVLRPVLILKNFPLEERKQSFFFTFIHTHSHTSYLLLIFTILQVKVRLKENYSGR